MDEVSQIETPDAGCPSGLQDEPIAAQDPLGKNLDLSSFVTCKDGRNEIDLIVQGAHCGGCLAKIERGMNAIDGVNHARMNLSTMRLNVAWDMDAQTSPQTLIGKLADMGYGAAPYEVSAAQSQSKAEVRGLLKAMAVAGFAGMNVMLLSISVWAGHGEMNETTRTVLHWLSAVIALPACAYAGQPFFRSAWKALKNKSTNMDVPISLAVILACALSLYETINHNPHTYFDAAMMLLFFLLIGRYLDAKLRARTGDAAQQLAAMQVSSATRILADGKLETVPASLIKPGDALLIPAGQRIPVDAEITSGNSEIDTQIATGETIPAPARPGDRIYSGTINLLAPLTVKAIAGASDSFLSEITKLVEAGTQSKSKYVKIADRAARAYVPVVHSLALLTFIGWLLVGADLRPATLNAIAVLIITCPCALGLAVPAVQIVAAGRLFKNGVLIKSGDALERLSQVKTAVFDKTGTLTCGKFTLTNAGDIPAQALEAAAALAKGSLHPIAKALGQYEGTLNAANVSETAGGGIQGRIDGLPAKFGSAKFVGIDHSDQGGTESYLAIDGQDPVRFCFTDSPRPDAQEALSALKDMGISAHMISGDAKPAVAAMAKQLGIDEWRAGVAPGEKQAYLNSLQASGEYPLMVGDGINDAPALASATASASLAAAADVSRAAADIILQGDKLSGLPIAVDIARKAQRRVYENLALAIIYNFIAIPLAVFGYVTPLIAALAMSGSSILVTLNALRLAAGRRE